MHPIAKHRSSSGGHADARTSRKVTVFGVLLGLGILPVPAGAYPEIRIQPISAAGGGVTFEIVDNSDIEGEPSEIILTSLFVTSVEVTLELKLRGWGDAAGGPMLASYQGTVDANTGFCSGDGDCLEVVGDLVTCSFIDTARPDFVFHPSICPVGPVPPYNCLEIGCSPWPLISREDEGEIYYGGTLLIGVPSAAAGTYTIPFVLPETKTFLIDENGMMINPLTKTAVKITIPTGRCCNDMAGPDGAQCQDGITRTMCQQFPPPRSFAPGVECEEPCPCMGCMTGGDCSDNDVCTTDICDNIETCACVHVPNYDVATECCNPATGEVLPLDDGVECTADICHPDGSVEHVLMDGLPCEHPDPCVIDAHCENALCVGALPGDWPDGIILCADDDDCPSELACNPIWQMCDCWNPVDVLTNRYLTFTTVDTGVLLAYRVTLTASTYFPTSTGPVGWLGEPFDASCVDDAGNPLPGEPQCAGEFASRLVDEPFFADTWPYVLRVADCPIVPVAGYEIHPTPDGVSFGDPIVRETIAKPDKWWADIVGAKAGDRWYPPDGFVNFDDIQAAIQTFEGAPDTPHWTWVDVEGAVPNAIINMTDVQLIVLAFEGSSYPFADPVNCSLRPYLGGYSDSGCLDNPRSGRDGYPDCGTPWLETTVEGNAIHVVNHSMTYDCAAGIEVELVVAAEVLTLIEIYTDGMADCLCCFDIESTIEGLAPGTYIVQYCLGGYQPGDPCAYTEEVTIPG